jgi:uncharacterized protein
MKDLKNSKYNIIIKQENGSLIYNTYSGAFGFIEGDYDLNDLLKTKDPLFSQLIEGGFIIRKDFDELNELKKIYYESRNDNKYLSITLLAREDCNFSCPYCFIYQRRPIKMNDEVYENCIKLIENKTNMLSHLKIQFFGGEPLLNHTKNIIFLEKINKLINSGVYKEFGLVTNGYLLDKSIFLDYLKRNVIFYQVTIDGSKNYHNKTRFTRNDKNTFDKIIKNIEDIKNVDGNFNFVIRVNFQSSDKEINKLISYFRDKFKNDKRFNFVFRPIMDFKTRKITDKIDICNEGEGKIKQMKYLLNFYRKDIIIYDERMVFLPKRIDSWCEAPKYNSFIIGADGVVFKCDVEISDKKFAVGVLKDNGEIELKENIYTSYDPYKDQNCLNCKLLPICQGGCIRSRIVNKEGCYYTLELIKQMMIEYHRMVSR